MTVEGIPVASSGALTRRPNPGSRFTVAGLLVMSFGLAVYIVAATSAAAIALISWRTRSSSWLTSLVWYSGIPTVVGFVFLTLGMLRRAARQAESREMTVRSVAGAPIVVGLTAWNDEDAVGRAVEDFRSHPLVTSVFVVENSSTDRTAARAAEAGATVITETLPGYGRVVYRSLQEAARLSPADAVFVLCEGDCTFRSSDIDKLLAYLPHADIVNGTRTASALVSADTQLTPAMMFGNLLAAKFLDIKYPGVSAISDLGTTYKALRVADLRSLLSILDPSVNLEFNAHLLDRSLAHGFTVVEVPVTFWPRVGVSKGGNVNHRRAAKVGFAMLWGIVAGW